MQSVWAQIRIDRKKVNFEKKPSDAIKNMKNYTESEILFGLKHYKLIVTEGIELQM